MLIAGNMGHLARCEIWRAGSWAAALKAAVRAQFCGGLHLGLAPGRAHDADVASADHYPGGMTTETATERWICESCGFIYDPEEGDPDGGIPPGTPFTEIPDTWFCPVCGARKKDFTPYDD